MEVVDFDKLTNEEVQLLEKAREAADHSISDLGHKIGCVIKCQNGKEYIGATNIRSRTIGSTCAERMALDQMYFSGDNLPKTCVLIGNLPEVDYRPQWSEDNICTPCGVCLETMRQVIKSSRLEDLDLLCSSWNKKKNLRAKLSELFPFVD